jgi:Cu(I)/Ag(I) efflux system membrane fusion protein
VSLKIKIIIAILITAGAVVFSVSCDNAKSSEKETISVKSKYIMDEEVGEEATCPVMKNTFKITKSTPVVEYKGERYYFCCSGCDDKFVKNPEKYIKEAGKHESKKAPHETTGEEEILYWTCSMHPEIKSDEEGNCPICGMNLIPVKKGHEHGGDDDGAYLYLKERDIALAGVKTVPALKKNLYKEIRATGVVAYDPTLVTAQEEYLNALKLLEDLSPEDKIALVRAKNVLDKAEYKLRLLGMSNSEIGMLREMRKVQSSFILPDKESWVYTDIYENDIGWVKKNQNVTVKPAAYPGLELEGKIKSINPVLNMNTRSAKIRIRLSHKDERLFPGMYVDVEIKAAYAPSGGKAEVVSVPKEAVINTGNRKVVWVYLGEGNFEPREVKIGPLSAANNGMREQDLYPVLHGIKESEMVVTNGNFLIDSESQITGVAAIGYGGAIGVEEGLHIGH